MSGSPPLNYLSGNDGALSALDAQNSFFSTPAAVLPVLAKQVFPISDLLALAWLRERSPYACVLPFDSKRHIIQDPLAKFSNIHFPAKAWLITLKPEKFLIGLYKRDNPFVASNYHRVLHFFISPNTHPFHLCSSSIRDQKERPQSFKLNYNFYT